MGDPRNIRILIVDDELAMLKALRRSLSSKYDVRTADDSESALDIIESEEPFAVVISDMELPGMDGVTLLSTIRYMNPLAVRILHTGQADLNTAVAAVNRGHVFRILLKPCDPDTMHETVADAVKHYEMSLHGHDEVQELAFLDDLTKLNNRRYLDIILAKEHSRARRHKRNYSVVFLDLDGLKKINADHGHLVGSQVIQHAGQIIRETMRTSDYAFRFGGDEFVVLLVESDVEGAVVYGNRLCEKIQAAEFPVVGSITASAGVAGFPDHGQTAWEVLNHADKALYKAKGKGRNQTASADKLPKAG